MKILYIMRGLPGSGKTTLAKELVGGGLIASTDDFWGPDYNFDPSRLTEAHDWNIGRVSQAMRLGVERIAVDNTNVRLAYFEPYVELAGEFGYEVSVAEVRVRLSDEELAARTIHKVPVEIIAKMREAWEELPDETTLPVAFYRAEVTP